MDYRMRETENMNTHLSTYEVAQVLNCSSENVRLLARSARLPIAIQTRAGRLFLRTAVRAACRPKKTSTQVLWGEGVSTPPWLITPEVAERGRCGPKLIYAEVKAGRLRAARVGGRRELRFKLEWIDQWLEDTAEPVGEITPLRRFGRPA